MFNGNQPPYPPAGQAYPPYPPPGFPPAQAGAFPPYPPPGYPPQPGAAYGYPPPIPGQFPPGFSPPAGYPPYPGTPPSGVPFRPPPGTPYLPSKPGLGAVSQYVPPISTATIMSNATPTFVKEVKTNTMFVGGIAPGITDDTLKALLSACGPLHQLKRVAGATGQPQAFGFALFVENPEVVLRAMRCLNGVELPDLTPRGRAEGLTKKLIINPDQKTKEFLEEFHKSVPRTEADDEGDARTTKSIAYIVQLLTDPSAQASPTTKAAALPSAAEARAAAQAAVPSHLKDLNEGDLPEAQREVVLDQIAVFREQAARKEKERKMLEADRERFRQNENRQQQHPQQQQPQQRQWGQRAGNQQSPVAPPSAGFGNGPQSYQAPVGFVKSQGAEGKGEGERTDEEEEELRQMKKLRERETMLRERERRLEMRERQRIETLTRDANRIKHEDETLERERRAQRERLARWDDEEKIERGRELFYSDRNRWRNVRQAARRREYQDDVRDRQQEADEKDRVERESEAFIQKQMEEMAEFEVKQRQAGLLFDDAAPVKLAIAPEIVKKDVSTPRAEDKPVFKPKIAFEGDDDDEIDAERKKKRTLVKLDYTGDTIPEAERVAKRTARLLEIKATLPKDKRTLWKLDVQWAAVNESAIARKFLPFVRAKMAEYLGELEDDDLVNFVLEQLREKKGPNDIVEGLEPVLEEEALAFTIQLWRQLTFESIAFVEGLETGTMTV